MEENTQKKNKLIKRALLLSTTALLLILIIIPTTTKLFNTVNKSITLALTPEKIDFTLEHIYSEQIKTNLVKFLDKNSKAENLAHFDPESFYRKLKKEFKIIKTVEWDFSNPKTARLRIEGTKPFCKINNKFILGNKKRIFEFDQFSDFKLDQLQNIEVAQEHLKTKIDPELFIFLSRIFEQTWEKYDLTFLKNSNITLQLKESNFKNNPQFVLNTKSFSNPEKLSSANKILGILNEELSKKLGRQKAALCDLRFKDRIIFYTKKLGGGTKNG
jgi:hypothetical protein